MEHLEQHKRPSTVRNEKRTGATTASRVMRSLRATWGKARSRRKNLPPNLLRGRAEDRGFAWNEEDEKRPLIAFRDLPAWWATVHELPPVRRDWNLVARFTAARRDDVKRMRWEHVDLDAGTVRFPEPKGGPKKAYTIPLASFVVDVLRRRQAENRMEFGDDDGWVFPIRNRTEGVTHIRQPVEMRYVDGKKIRVLPAPHELRRTGITAADRRITRRQAEALANHGGAGGVHDRYIITSEDEL